MSDSEKKLTKADQQGVSVAKLFRNTVTGVQQSLRENTGVGAVDIAVHFKSVDIVKKSQGFVVFSKNKQSESSIEIKLATRVYPASGDAAPVQKTETQQHSEGSNPSTDDRGDSSPPGKAEKKRVQGVEADIG